MDKVSFLMRLKSCSTAVTVETENLNKTYVIVLVNEYGVLSKAALCTLRVKDAPLLNCTGIFLGNL